MVHFSHIYDIYIHTGEKRMTLNFLLWNVFSVVDFHLPCPPSQHPVLQLELVAGITEMEMEGKESKREKKEARRGQREGSVEGARTDKRKDD